MPFSIRYWRSAGVPSSSKPYEASWPGTVGSKVTLSSSEPYWYVPNMSGVTKLVPA